MRRITKQVAKYLFEEFQMRGKESNISSFDSFSRAFDFWCETSNASPSQFASAILKHSFFKPHSQWFREFASRKEIEVDQCGSWPQWRRGNDSWIGFGVLFYHESADDESWEMSFREDWRVGKKGTLAPWEYDPELLGDPSTLCCNPIPNTGFFLED